MHAWSRMSLYRIGYPKWNVLVESTDLYDINIGRDFGTSFAEWRGIA